MRSNTGSPGFVGKTNGLCQSPSFLDQEGSRALGTRLMVHETIMARNDGHACAQRLVNKQQFYQTSMLKFIGVTLGK